MPLWPDLIGVSTFRDHEIRPGWMPSLLRGRGVLDDYRSKQPPYIGHMRLPIPVARTIVCVTDIRWSSDNEAFRRGIHPSGLPLACG